MIIPGNTFWPIMADRGRMTTSARPERAIEERAREIGSGVVGAEGEPLVDRQRPGRLGAAADDQEVAVGERGPSQAGPRPAAWMATSSTPG